MKGVSKLQFLENRIQLVVTIGAPAQNPQGQIDLAVGVDGKGFKG